jgi:hypothetical protein
VPPVTGGGFATRRLYTDSEESTFYAKRPVIANGIEEVATRGDLLSRAIVVQLPVLEAVRDESTLEAEWATAHPAILGALLDAASAALRNWSSTHLGEHAPRMADFARWVVASGAVPGLLDTYAGNRSESQGTEIDASPFASAVLAFVAERGKWEGTATDLLRELVAPWGDDAKYWPSNPKAMGDRLRRHAPALRGRGVGLEFRRANGVRTLPGRLGSPPGRRRTSTPGSRGWTTPGSRATSSRCTRSRSGDPPAPTSRRPLRWLRRCLACGAKPPSRSLPTTACPHAPAARTPPRTARAGRETSARVAHPRPFALAARWFR